MVYVDDFKPAGPPEALSYMCQHLCIGEPGPVDVLLGCTQRESRRSHASLQLQQRILECHMEDSLVSSLALFQ